MSAGVVRGFDELTPIGQQRRLRLLALDALREYDIDVARCTFVARAFNNVFRVDATDGSRFALRVSPSGRIHAEGCELVEAAWVATLRRDAGLPVADVIEARDGSVVVWASAAGIPEPRSCVLFEWVPGRRLRECLTVDLARKTGALTAAVHEHGAAYAGDESGPPAGALVADRVLYFRTPGRLDELAPTYGSVLTDAADRAQGTLDDLWRNPPHRPHLLHGDVQTANVMVQRGEVVLIDFQDLIWGFEVQDVGFALRSFEYLEGGDAYSSAFRAGYESLRAWPEADRETWAALRAARHLNILNIGLSLGWADVDTFVARHAAPVVDWMNAAQVDG